MTKNIQFLTIAVFVALFVFCKTPRGPESNGMLNSRSASGAAIEGFVTKPVVLDRSISVPGTLKPFEETVLMPEVSGRVVAINLPEGKTVKKGMLLVKLFDGDLQAQLKKTKAQLDIAKLTRDRLDELIKINGVSRSDHDQAVLQVNALNADVDILAVQIAKTEVVAPYDGTLGLRNLSIGAQVTPSTPLATIREVDKMKLDFSVPEKYSREVKQGMQISFSAEGDKTAYSATVMATEQGIDAATRNLKVRALVEKNDGFLKPGSFARVTLRLSTVSGAIMIPTQAIIPEDRNKRVIVAQAGKAKFVIIQTGERRESMVEVTDGLSAGDTVAITGLLFIKPGAELKFSKVTQ